MTPLIGSPFATVTGSSSLRGIEDLAFTPDGTRAVAGFGFSEGVQGLSVSAAGALAPTGTPAEGAEVNGLAVSPDGHFAYVPTRNPGSEGIRGFAIAADGSLTSLGPGFGSGSYGDIAITPDGRHLFAADYSTDELARFAIAADGSLTELVGATTVPLPPDSLAVSPDGRFLFATFTNGFTEEGFTSYAIGADGGLVEAGEPVLFTEDSLYYLAVSPDGAHLYVADRNHGVITAAVGADGGLSVLRTMPAERAESVAVSPDGRFLYYQYFDGTAGEEGIGVAELGADGTPTPLPGVFEPWQTDEAERLVFAPSPPSAAAFTAVGAAPGAATSFDASASVGAVRYDWDFGDGTALADGGSTPSHVYASPGTYTATLTVTDANGCSTQQIYTGQSKTCPGGPAAETSHTVVVATPEEPGSEETGSGSGSGGGSGGSTTPPAATAPTTTATTPRVLSLAVTPKRFAVARSARPRNHRQHRRAPLGTAFRYRLSEAATVRFTIERKQTGRSAGKHCRRATRRGHRHKKSCARFQTLGTLTAKAKAGLNTTAFNGRLHGKKLYPGLYRVTAVAIATGERSQPRRATFRVVSR